MRKITLLLSLTALLLNISCDDDEQLTIENNERQSLNDLLDIDEIAERNRSTEDAQLVEETQQAGVPTEGATPKREIASTYGDDIEYIFDSLLGECLNADRLPGLNDSLLLKECSDQSGKTFNQRFKKEKGYYGSDFQNSVFTHSKLNFRKLTAHEIKYDHQTRFDNVTYPRYRLFSGEFSNYNRQMSREVKLMGLLEKWQEKIKRAEREYGELEEDRKKKRLLKKIAKWARIRDKIKLKLNFTLAKKSRFRNRVMASFKAANEEIAVKFKKARNRYDLELSDQQFLILGTGQSLLGKGDNKAISFWINPKIIDSNPLLSSDRFGLAIESGELVFSEKHAPGRKIVLSDSGLEVGEWSFVHLNLSKNRFKAFLNGEELNLVESGELFPANAMVRLGIHGRLDQVMIWDKHLPYEDLLHLHNFGQIQDPRVIGNVAYLRLWWDMKPHKKKTNQYVDKIQKMTMVLKQ